MSTEHPDEGTIHAWLDGELGEAESARLAAHVAGCERCSAATAEARGLVAGASRVVAALDPDGAPVARPVATAATSTAPTPRWLRVTPARASIAAALLVVAGLTLLHDRAAQDSALVPPPVATSPGATANPMAAAAPARDPLLDSAIKRNIAQALPPRRLERAPGPSVVPPLAPEAPTAVDTTAGLRVAEGRMEARARADMAPAAAEHAAAPRAVAGAAANGVGATALSARAARSTVACYRVEAGVGGVGATWGDVALPLVVRLADDGTWAAVGDSAVGDSAVTGRWKRLAGDSVRLERKGEAVIGKGGGCK